MKARTGRYARFRTCAAFTLLLVGGCDPGDESLDRLRVAYTRHMTMSPLFIAQEEGFFTEQGLDVELVAVERSSVAMPALMNGQLDVLPGPVSSAVFNAIHRGARVRMVTDKGAYDASGCTHQALVASVAATAGEDPPVFERFGTANEHFTHFIVDRALRAEGYDPDAMEMYTIPQAAEYDALMAGRLDGAFVGEPWLTRILEVGGGIMRAAPNELFDGYQYSVILFGPRLLDEEPELGERFAIAMVNALRAYNEGKNDRNLDILSDIIGLDRGELTEFCWPTMGTDGFVHIESIMNFQRWAFERGEQDAVVAPEDFWEPRFVEHAAQVLAASD